MYCTFFLSSGEKTPSEAGRDKGVQTHLIPGLVRFGRKKTFVPKRENDFFFLLPSKAGGKEGDRGKTHLIPGGGTREYRLT